jgi:hypothetical protein
VSGTAAADREETMPDRSPRLGKHLIEVIQKQIDDDDPPDAREAYDRLVTAGHAEEEVYGMVACAFTSVIFASRRAERDFDVELYAARLWALPQMPWE